MKTIKEKLQLRQDLDQLKYVFLICAEFELKKTSVNSCYKENNFKPCLTKQLLNTFKLWCEWGYYKSPSKLRRV